MISIMSNANLNNKNTQPSDKDETSNSDEANKLKRSLSKTQPIHHKYTLFKKDYDLNENSSCSTSSSSSANLGDQRTIDAADTLVSLAHSATTTPPTEFNPFVSSSTTTSTTNANNIEIVSLFVNIQ